MAAAQATAVGAKTLGQTLGGKVALKVANVMEYCGCSYPTISKYVWSPASRMFASNTKSFGGMMGQGGKIWNTVEKPILKARGLFN